MAHSADIVGYTYNSDNYCPSHIVEQLPTGEGGDFDGWALASGADPMTPEDNLREIAFAFIINVEDEHSFDSGYFPKVIFRDQADDSQCGVCGERLRD